MTSKKLICDTCGNWRSVNYCDTCYHREYYHKKKTTMTDDFEWMNCEIERLRELMKMVGSHFNDTERVNFER